MRILLNVFFSSWDAFYCRFMIKSFYSHIGECFLRRSRTFKMEIPNHREIKQYCIFEVYHFPIKTIIFSNSFSFENYHKPKRIKWENCYRLRKFFICQLSQSFISKNCESMLLKTMIWAELFFFSNHKHFYINTYKSND